MLANVDIATPQASRAGTSSDRLARAYQGRCAGRGIYLRDGSIHMPIAEYASRFKSDSFMRQVQIMLLRPPSTTTVTMHTLDGPISV
jgi:hypothetical protein